VALFAILALNLPVPALREYVDDPLRLGLYELLLIAGGAGLVVYGFGWLVTR
jgi:hypothetical protein